MHQVEMQAPMDAVNDLPSSTSDTGMGNVVNQIQDQVTTLRQKLLTQVFR